MSRLCGLLAGSAQEKSLLCDPRSELRLGGREKRRAKIKKTGWETHTTSSSSCTARERTWYAADAGGGTGPLQQHQRAEHNSSSTRSKARNTLPSPVESVYQVYDTHQARNSSNTCFVIPSLHMVTHRLIFLGVQKSYQYLVPNY